MKAFIFLSLLWLHPMTLFGFQPLTFIKSNQTTPTLINSVSFHPEQSLFCVTFTHHHQIGLYQIHPDKTVELVQMITNPDGLLSYPQNAVFSRDGRHLFVVNWGSRDFNVYPVNDNGTFSPTPKHIISVPLSEEQYRPHGMCFSPKGDYLAVAYGSFEDAPWTIVLYRVTGLDSDTVKLSPCSSLKNDTIINGVPKGISFSADGSSLVVTFTQINSLRVFAIDWDKECIISSPTQEIRGEETKLSRPEDIAFSADGTSCAVSNSAQNTVSFYRFDKINNRFTENTPYKILTNLLFPHGLEFSPDGRYFAVTQFGLVQCSDRGYISSWGQSRMEGVSLFTTDE